MPILDRDPLAHKGDHGALGILGGAQGTVGAAFLSARTALFSGTGRVYVVRPNLNDGVLFDALCPEIMVISHGASRQKPINAWVIGPGLGLSDSAHELLTSVLSVNLPVVIDADALNLIAEDPALGRQCARRTSPTVLTPHPGEAGRLLATTTAEIEARREQSACELAQKYRAISVLKGHATVIAPSPDMASETAVVTNASGNVALATAGTGDVLAGLMGALIAQGVAVHRAVVYAVNIHGLSAERVSHAVGGPIGATASELIPEIRRLLNEA